MIKYLISLLLLCNVLYAKIIVPNEVYGEVKKIQYQLESILLYYGIKYEIDKIKQSVQISTSLKPRSAWQKSYEIMIKINFLRTLHNLPIIEPINMAPVLHLNPNLVYEQTQRILAELRIFKYVQNIANIDPLYKAYTNKTPLDVYNEFAVISALLDVLNKVEITPSYVFGENMRIYKDLSQILDLLDIHDDTIPAKKNTHATPTNTFITGMLTLEKIKQLQILSGIDFINFNSFKKLKQTPSEVFSITEMIIAELQTIKAYLKISTITPPATEYHDKTPSEVDQLMSWNLRKLNLIRTLDNVVN